ncbi:MAG: hypothetical protein R3C53_18855 [Pirellulaceae bacterium]
MNFPQLTTELPTRFSVRILALQELMAQRHARMRGLRGQLVHCLHSPWVLVLCKIAIGLVSAYDVFLTVKYYESLPTMELNPIGRWLMQLENGPDCQLNQIAGFVAAKFAGNFIVIGVIELLVTWRKSVATLVAIAMAIFQLGLLYILLAGKPF